MKRQRYAVLVELHESQVENGRVRIGQLELQRQQQEQYIAAIQGQQAQEGAQMGNMAIQMHAQYAQYCTHTQQRIQQHQNQLMQIATAIETAWNEMREAQRSLDIFLSLQKRQTEKDMIAEKRRDQQRCQDFALMKWLETGS